MIAEQQLPLNILLADDDADDRSFFENALKEIPVDTRLTMVNDGEQLMDHLSKNQVQLPDVLFLDLSMPRKGGFECLTEMKDDIKLKDIPIVMFSTSYTQDFNYELGMIAVLYKLGVQDYIRKPGTVAELKELILHSFRKVIKESRLNLQEVKL
ncbi:MAG TPA: response regulator [Chitinophagaceae bacterium]|nr:response regulator [Chitinophagaceae bacterium]